MLNRTAPLCHGNWKKIRSEILLIFNIHTRLALSSIFYREKRVDGQWKQHINKSRFMFYGSPAPLCRLFCDAMLYGKHSSICSGFQKVGIRADVKKQWTMAKWSLSMDIEFFYKQVTQWLNYLIESKRAYVRRSKCTQSRYRIMCVHRNICLLDVEDSSKALQSLRSPLNISA